MFTAVGVSLASYGVPEAEHCQYMQDVEAVGALVSPLTERADRWAQAAWGLPGADAVVQGVATGFAWQQAEPDEFFRVENYVPPEHEEKVALKLQEEEDAGRMVRTNVESVPGVSALGIVLRVVDGKTVRVKEVERLVGQLMFCARVVYGAKMFLSSGYDFIGRAGRKRRFYDTLPVDLSRDLMWLAKMLEEYNCQEVVLNRRPVVRDFFAVDAAGEE
eukprot:gene34626-biopygen34583